MTAKPARPRAQSRAIRATRKQYAACPRRDLHFVPLARPEAFVKGIAPLAPRRSLSGSCRRPFGALPGPYLLHFLELPRSLSSPTFDLLYFHAFTHSRAFPKCYVVYFHAITHSTPPGGVPPRWEQAPALSIPLLLQSCSGETMTRPHVCLLCAASRLCDSARDSFSLRGNS